MPLEYFQFKKAHPLCRFWQSFPHQITDQKTNFPNNKKAVENQKAIKRKLNFQIQKTQCVD